ncbi:MAG: hypothetical protein HZA91_14640 [Verrucomicrobia bacterium]|nr:hypothetical protein [Verrucomicrobiota bacterium]
MKQPIHSGSHSIRWLLPAVAAALTWCARDVSADLALLEPKPGQSLTPPPKTLHMQWEWRQVFSTDWLASAFTLTLQPVDAAGKPAGNPIVVLDRSRASQGDLDTAKLLPQGPRWQWTVIAWGRSAFGGYKEIGRLTGVFDFGR